MSTSSVTEVMKIVPFLRPHCRLQQRGSSSAKSKMNLTQEPKHLLQLLTQGQ